MRRLSSECRATFAAQQPSNKRGFSISQLMAEPLELKKTLNLPKTDFPMKASLPQNEPKQLVAWEDAHLYEKILETREGQAAVCAARWAAVSYGNDSPGDRANKILKDMIVKSESMAGHYAPYVPGWDCHGLPIETQVEKELGGKGKVPRRNFASYAAHSRRGTWSNTRRISSDWECLGDGTILT